MSGYYQLGIIDKVILYADTGDPIEITGAEVEVTIEQETLDHYARSPDGLRVRYRAVVNENKQISIKTRDNVGEQLMRLIRED